MLFRNKTNILSKRTPAGFSVTFEECFRERQIILLKRSVKCKSLVFDYRCKLLYI